MKKDYSVLLIQLDRNLASDVSTRCSGRPKLSSYQVESREPNNLSSIVFILIRFATTVLFIYSFSHFI